MAFVGGGGFFKFMQIFKQASGTNFKGLLQLVTLQINSVDSEEAGLLLRLICPPIFTRARVSSLTKAQEIQRRFSEYTINSPLVCAVLLFFPTVAPCDQK